MSRIRSSCPRALSFAALVFMCVMPLRATGEPVFGEVFRIPQPDASSVGVRIWGDEFYQVIESLDGFTLTRDPASGVLCYAQLSSDGTVLISTGLSASYPAPQSLGLQRHVRIAPTAARSQARAARARFYSDTLTASAASRDSLRALSPTTGEVVGICLIVDFVDDPASGYDIPPGEVRAFCNDVGYTGFGNNGSVRDYYYDVSDGALTFTQFVPDAYYRASAEKLYYTNRSWPFGIRARELVLEALYALDDSGFAFDDYDANDDGVIDGISCLYAGPRHSPWGEGLWPHTWYVDFSADGVTTNKYAISDMYLDTGDVEYYLRLSTFCHEAGHMMFDWPDLYDYDFDSAGVGAYCIMAGHNNYTSHTNPQDPCAYLKYLAGWSTTTLLTTPQFGLPVPAGVNTFYKYEHPTAANEYFLIENRQQLARDVGLPDAGLAVWHIDTLGSNAHEQMPPDDHYEVTLVQADGQWDLETNANNGDSTDLWSAPGYSALTPYTTPDTRWWDGSNSRLYLRDISTADPTMTFSFFTGEDCNNNSIPDEEDIASGTSSDCNTNAIPDECDIAEGFSLDCQPNGIPDECELSGNDCNSNAVPDECELPGNDCNTNGVLDVCDLSSGTSLDCQPNAIPDECELTDNDCNTNGIPDECELADNDCNTNGIPDDCELAGHDCNGNGTLDVCDIASGTSEDCQPNGQPDECELVGNDCNGNAIPDECELAGHDCNTNGILDECDISTGTSEDCQSNAIPDECELADNDCDANGVPDECDLPGHDCNANGVLDVCDIATGTSLDCQPNGIPDECELAGNDCNTNGIPDDCELPGHDCNGNGTLDVCDIASGTSEDCQPNGTPDECELDGNDCNGNMIPDECELAGHDCNSNGTLDECDVSAGTSEDCQSNGIPDECELTDNDCDANGIPDECDLPGHDCNTNGVLDVCDIASGTSLDCQPNGIPDECELADNDCNTNGIPDECELSGHDCNTNGVLDVCDIASGASEDCQGNGVPDECELIDNDCDSNGVPDECDLPGNDCNANGILDVCDIASGFSEDCQPNGTPDECELVDNDCDGNGTPDECQLAEEDCNDNGTVDVCDLAVGTSEDCNANLVPDECDVASGTSLDCNLSGVPDECELAGNDCNANNIPDECELAGNDCNANVVLDECDIALGTSLDCQGDGQPDECQLLGNDCNINGIPDDCEVEGNDCNSNGVPDECDVATGSSADCQGNGVPDECELFDNDCNTNDIPDECELAGNDCNANGIIDECDVASGASDDCQSNGIPDECELEDNDCNGTLIPDECELGPGDCNANGIPDECDLVAGTSADCNNTNVPDECELAGNDCDSSGVPDECELAGNDCNGNFSLDVCDIISGTSPDCNSNGTPDECELAGNDCNGSSVPDDCELEGNDCNHNGTPDECDVASGESHDDNANGVPDECEPDPCVSTRATRLTAPDASAEDWFGHAVAVADGVLVIGAEQDDDYGDRSGSAHVFRYDGADWVPEAKLLPAAIDAADDLFGGAVAVSGQRVLVGAYNDDFNNRTGTAYLFEFENGNWSQTTRLLPVGGDKYELFGAAVTLTGNIAVVGAQHGAPLGRYSGAAYVYRFNGSAWIPEAKLVASDGSPFDYFGVSVAGLDDTIVVGANGDDDNGTSAGCAYVFRYDGANWIEEQKLLASHGAQGDGFGISVAISGSGIIVGAYRADARGVDSGAAYVFEFDGMNWVETQKLLPADLGPGDFYGYSVAMAGAGVIIGADKDDDAGMDAGAAYVFQRSGTTWLEKAKLLPFSGAAEDSFGRAVAIDESGVGVAGTHGYDGSGSRSGAAFVFHGLTADCNSNYAIDLCDITLGTSADDDGDGIPDECAVGDPADFDQDGDVDLDDHRSFVDCAADPDRTPTPTQGTSTRCLEVFDSDDDTDVDLYDFAAFQRLFRQ